MKTVVALLMLCLGVSSSVHAQTWIVQQRALNFGSITLGSSTTVAATSSDTRSGMWALTIGSGKPNCKVDLTLTVTPSATTLSSSSSLTINVTYTQAVLVNADGTTVNIAVGSTVTKVGIVYPANVYIGGTILESYARAGAYAGSLTLTGANTKSC